MKTALTYSRGRVAVPTIESGTLITREAGQFAAPLLSCPVRASEATRLSLPVGRITPEAGALLVYLDPDHAYDAPEQAPRGRVLSWLTDAVASTLTVSGALPRSSGDPFLVEEATTNLVENPRGGALATNDWSVNIRGLFSAISEPLAPHGTAFLIVAEAGTLNRVVTSNPGTHATSLAQGTKFSVRAKIRARNVAAVGHVAQLLLYEVGGASPAQSLTGGSLGPVLTADFTEVKIEGATIAQTGRTGLQFYIGFQNSMAGGEEIEWTDVQVEQQSVCTSYADGSLGPGYAFTGVAHDSPSTRAAGRVQIATAGLITPTQGWGAARIRYGRAYNAAPSSNPCDLLWVNGTSRIHVYRRDPSGGSPNQWSLRRTDGVVDTTAVCGSAQNNAIGDRSTILAEWTSANLSITDFGASSATATAANTALPDLSPAASADLDSSNGGDWINGGRLWRLFGTGVLSPADRTTINGWGDTPPTVEDILSTLSDEAVPTALWDGLTTTYIATLPSGVQAWLDKATGTLKVRRHIAGTGESVSVAWAPEAGEATALLVGWEASQVFAAVNGGSVAAAPSSAIPPSLPDSYDLGSVSGASDYLDAAYGAAVEMLVPPTEVQWQALAALRTSRPPLLGEHLNGGMSSLWYGANPFLWALPSGAAVLDLVNTEGVRFDRLLGAGTAPVEHRGVETPLRDGKLYITSRLKERRLIAKLVLQGESVAAWYALRRELMAALTPRSGEGVLMYAPSQAVYEIDALLHSGLGIDDAEWLRGERPSVVFDCLDPAWRNTAQAASLQSVPLSGWSVPWSLPWPFTASAQTFVLANDGDLPTYPVFTVTAGGSGATGIAFANAANGKRYQTANGFVLGAGEVLLVDMDARTATKQDGSNQISQRTTTSEMWSLEVGENAITVSNESGSATVQVGYRRRYVGV